MEITVRNIAAIKTVKNAKNPQKSNRQSFKQNNAGLSNVYYQPIFQRNWSDHKSWGAVVDPDTKDVSFKLFTFPDAQEASVTVIKKDCTEDNKKEKTYLLKNFYNGIFATQNPIPKEEIQDGDSYFYTITKSNGEKIKVKDPYSFKQDKLLGESVIYDQSKYIWHDKDWFENNTNRISRLASPYNKLKSPQEARIYELNIATLSKKGDFEGAKSALQNIKKLGFNTIEIMPVENTYSFNWGYDGVDKHAVSKFLGGPDGLKSFVDEAHNVGLNVIMDWVPNHLGPDGASLKQTGPYIKGQNDFGESFNFNGKNSKYVRDYIVNAALNWLDNYHCDGLRLDMTKYIESDTTLKQIAAEVNYHKPDAFLIAEDSRQGIEVNAGRFWRNEAKLHDNRIVSPLKPFEYAAGEGEENHKKAIKAIEADKTSLSNLGYDSEWDFPFYHITKDTIYGNINLDNLERMFLESQSRVKYILSHDEKGNFDGTALAAKIMVPTLNIRDNIILNEEDLKRAQDYSNLKGCSIDEAKEIITSQKAQFNAEKLAIMLSEGKFDKYENKSYETFYKEILSQLGIKKESGIDVRKVKRALDNSYKIIKMVLARTYATPGPKMVFQGDEKFDITPFRFFRQFQSIENEDYLYIEKGYKQGLSALKESKIGTISYSAQAKKRMEQFSKLTHDLNAANEKNPALTKGQIQTAETVKHVDSNVIATHLRFGDNEIFAITNYSPVSYPVEQGGKYGIQFPKGVWREIINTDSIKYGGKNNVNTRPIRTKGTEVSVINLAEHSTLIFKKISN